MSFWILAGIVLVVWLAWEFWPQKPYAFWLHEHGGLKPVLHRFLAHGRDKAQLKISVDAPDHFLIFRKRVASPADTSMQAQLTREPWSEPYYHTLRDELAQRGIASLEDTDDSGKSVLVVQLGQDVALGYMVALAAFDQVFKVPLFDRRAQWDRMSTVRHPSVTGIIK